MYNMEEIEYAKCGCISMRGHDDIDGWEVFPCEKHVWEGYKSWQKQ